VLDLGKLLEYVRTGRPATLHEPDLPGTPRSRPRRSPTSSREDRVAVSRRARPRCGTRRATTIHGLRRGWCDGDEGRNSPAPSSGCSRWRGACILYQGDEIGLEAASVPPDRERDNGRVAIRGRTPMIWSDEGRAPASPTPAVEPWLPIGSRRGRNVVGQRDDPNSILTLTRDLIALRPERPACYRARTPRSAAPRGCVGRSRPRARRLRRAETSVTSRLQLEHVEGRDRDRNRPARAPNGRAVEPVCSSFARREAVVIRRGSLG